MPVSRTDYQVRLAAFDWLEEQVDIHNDVLPWSLLLEGFTFRGTRVPLLSQQGIFKPAVLPEIPLSIRTSPSGPYDDRISGNDVLLYRYRGTDPRRAEEGDAGPGDCEPVVRRLGYAAEELVRVGLSSRPLSTRYSPLLLTRLCARPPASAGAPPR